MLSLEKTLVVCERLENDCIDETLRFCKVFVAFLTGMIGKKYQFY
jgi:hypothetical protein